MAKKFRKKFKKISKKSLFSFLLSKNSKVTERKLEDASLNFTSSPSPDENFVYQIDPCGPKITLQSRGKSKMKKFL